MQLLPKDSRKSQNKNSKISGIILEDLQWKIITDILMFEFICKDLQRIIISIKFKYTQNSVNFDSSSIWL